jgi:hypothetical protein
LNTETAPTEFQPLPLRHPSFAAGGIIPTIPFVQNFPFLDELVRSGRVIPLPDNIITIGVAAVFCFVFGFICRALADKIIDGPTD